MKRILLTIGATLLLSLSAYAHGPEKGPNGGPRVDAGDYHVELVAKDKAITAYISNDKDAPVDAKGFKATGIFVIAGKSERIEMKPETANKLTGTSTVALPATIKGALLITLPDGKTVQAKFE